MTRADSTIREAVIILPELACPECREPLEVSYSPVAGAVLACALCAGIYQPAELLERAA